jgi:N,N'-diacetyllegionaminate synthase
MKKTIIIAEAGVNHNGSINLAKKMIDIAEFSGVDYVKFQTFKTELCISKNAIKAEYQIQESKIKDETQFEMVKKLELTNAAHE